MFNELCELIVANKDRFSSYVNRHPPWHKDDRLFNHDIDDYEDIIDLEDFYGWQIENVGEYGIPKFSDYYQIVWQAQKDGVVLNFIIKDIYYDSYYNTTLEYIQLADFKEVQQVDHIMKIWQ